MKTLGSNFNERLKGYLNYDKEKYDKGYEKIFKKKIEDRIEKAILAEDKRIAKMLNNSYSTDYILEHKDKKK